MIDVNDLRNGVTFELDGQLFRVLEYWHNKPGRGKATIRTKVRDLRTGSVVEKTFISGTRVQDIRLDHRNVQFLYRQDDLFTFMDTDTYEQPTLNASSLGDSIPYLTEGLEVKLILHDQEPLEVELPTAVELKVTQAEAGLKGDTATGANKTVTTETGLKVQVPLFVSTGDKIRVDTRTGEYITRV